MGRQRKGHSVKRIDRPTTKRWRGQLSGLKRKGTYAKIDIKNGG
uniref:Uncharacterized protein n=1 Tax=Anguilla anguilla TaxID=7936 RepID=A0A0E9T417_ANGAN